jgi:hypothetical protein
VQILQIQRAESQQFDSDATPYYFKLNLNLLFFGQELSLLISLICLRNPLIFSKMASLIDPVKKDVLFLVVLWI